MARRSRDVIVPIAAILAALLLGWWLMRLTAGEPPPRPAPTVTVGRTAPPAPPPPPVAPDPGPAQEPAAPPEPEMAAEDSPAPPLPEPKEWVLSGVVREEDGLPIPGARVAPDLEMLVPFLPDGRQLSEEYLAPLVAAAKAVVADGEGRFELPLRMPEGIAVSLLATAEGFLPRKSGVLLVEQGRDRLLSIELERAVGIEGRVVDQEGNPVGGARVLLLEVPQGEEFTPFTTASDGRFRIPEAAARPWTLEVWPPPAPPGEAWTRHCRRHLVHGGDREVEIVILRRRLEGARVLVEVVDAATGEGVLPKQWSVFPSDGVASQVDRLALYGESKRGSFVMEVAEPGPWRAWVLLPDGRVGSVHFRVEPGDTEVRARIDVTDGGSIGGDVDWSAVGKPPRVSLVVNVRIADSVGYPQYASTFSEGRMVAQTGAPVASGDTFLAKDLIPGRYVVTLLCEGAWAREEVEVRANRRAKVRLVPGPAALIRFRLENPVPGAEWNVLVHPIGDPAQRSGIFEALGSGDPLVRELAVPPGPLYWKSEVRPFRGGSSLVQLAPTRSGTVEAKAGEGVEIMLTGE